MNINKLSKEVDSISEVLGLNSVVTSADKYSAVVTINAYKEEFSKSLDTIEIEYTINHNKDKEEFFEIYVEYQYSKGPVVVRFNTRKESVAWIFSDFVRELGKMIMESITK